MLNNRHWYFMAYKYMGCTLDTSDDGFNYVFRVWAPNALSIGLISDFTGWDEPYPMERVTDGGIYEIRYSSPVSLDGSAYKFRITTKSGRSIDKGDPYAAFSRGGADGASLIFAESQFTWSDDAPAARKLELYEKYIAWEKDLR